MHVFKAYPKRKYDAYGNFKVVQDEIEEHELGDSWKDSPAFFDKVSEPVSEPEKAPEPEPVKGPEVPVIEEKPKGKKKAE